ncbi:hypothetical protein SLE2022_113600 [Rubroshorea leprosula]
MKVLGIYSSLFLFGIVLLVLSFSVTEGSSFIPDMGLSQHGGGMTAAINRKLKGHAYDFDPSNVDLEDYHPVDPPPSSKASISPGPIEHGSPLIPYIPGPLPPSPPNTGGST